MDYPFLGASPDEFAQDKGNNWFPIEIKCPYTTRNFDLDDLLEDLSKKKK